MKILITCFSFIVIHSLFSQQNNENSNDIASLYLIEAEKNLTVDSTVFKKYIDSAIVISDKNGLIDIKSKALITMGVFYYNTAQYTLAMEAYVESLRVIENKNFPALEAKAYDNIGLVNYAIQNYDKAIENSLKALSINKKIGDSAVLIRNHNNLGINFYMIKDFDKAIFHYQKSKDLSEKFLDYRGVITSLSNIALVKSELKNYEGALEDYLYGLQIAREIEEPLTISYVLLNLGSTYTLIEKPLQAIETLKESQEIGLEYGFLDVVKNSHLYLAEAYAENEDFELSLIERKKYDKIKDSLLTIQTNKEIIEIETKYDTKVKVEQIAKQNSIISSYSNQFKWFLMFIFGLTLIITITIYKYIKGKKRAELQKNYFDEQYKLVAKENLQLKERLLQISSRADASSPKKSREIKYKKSTLSPEQRELFVKQLLDFMELNKPYLNPEISPQDISEELNISKHNLSEVLNLNLEMNFYRFMNLYRVEKAKEIISTDTLNLTLFAVASDSGFNSKSSFNRAFKDITGITPSSYKSSLQVAEEAF